MKISGSVGCELISEPPRCASLYLPLLNYGSYSSINMRDDSTRKRNICRKISSVTRHTRKACSTSETQHRVHSQPSRAQKGLTKALLRMAVLVSLSTSGLRFFMAPDSEHILLPHPVTLRRFLGNMLAACSTSTLDSGQECVVGGSTGMKAVVH